MASAYWEHRAELRQLAYDRSNNKVVADVSRAYDRTMRQLNEDIDSIISTYQRKTGLSVREAYDFLRDGVPAGVMDDLRARAAAITDKTQAKRLGVMLRTDAYRARISRLDAIKASTRVGLTEAAEAELRAITPHLRHTADLAYSRTMFDIQKATVGFQMVGVPGKALDTILKSKWSGAHYSTSVWQNRDAMAGILDRALMEVSGMGKLSDMTMHDVRGMVDLNKWRSQVKSKFKTEAQYQKYAANRLIRTESAYVAGQTTAVAYEECGIERYEYMATLDSRTSEKCSGLDGKIFEVSEKEVGVNYPPAHPHCRSSVAPVIDGLVREGLTRSARDASGKSVYVPRDMKYQEWKAWQEDGAPDIAEWRNKNTPKPIVKPKGTVNDNLYPKKLGGVKRTEITPEQANGGRVNPGFNIDSRYMKNCQSCVPTYEARMRGYNVKAKPYMVSVRNKKMYYLADDPRLAWIDPKTGEAPQYLMDDKVITPKGLFDKLTGSLEQDARYSIHFQWNERNAGHIITMSKNAAGGIDLYDPQAGQWTVGNDKVTQYFSRMQFEKNGRYTGPKWMRMDDKVINPKYTDVMLEAADDI